MLKPEAAFAGDRGVAAPWLLTKVLLGGGGMRALPLAGHLADRDEPRHHPVEVIRLNLQVLRDLRNGDARLLANELERLRGTRATVPPPARAARPAPATPWGRGGARSRRTARSPASAEQCGAGGLQSGDLLLELLQAAVDL